MFNKRQYRRGDKKQDTKENNLYEVESSTIFARKKTRAKIGAQESVYNTYNDDDKKLFAQKRACE